METFIAEPNTVSDPAWYPDSEATNHLSNDLNNVTIRGDYSVTSNSTDFINALIQKLSFDSAVNDLGNLRYFLGVEVTASPTGLVLSQTKYVKDLFQRAHMDGARSISTPMTRQGILMICDPLMVIVFLSGLIWYHGVPRSKELFHDLVLNLNTEA
uniref:Reverse transcriptase Ty1/copia-type domain-containing protein n=1 Tax=Solanum lycopersicum TaxID=4081 RepID=A0A3Q7GJS1_SOLLC